MGWPPAGGAAPPFRPAEAGSPRLEAAVEKDGSLFGGADPEPAGKDTSFPEEDETFLFAEGRRRLIPGYEITGVIGSGSVSTVYRARRLSDGREAVLKALHPRLAKDADFVQAYLDEAGAVSRFHHPHIVQAFDVGEAGGIYYYAEEFLPGGSLADRLGSGGAFFSEPALLLFLRQAVSALRHAWEAAVHHGDLNPANLLLDANGDLKLANLGVPRVAASTRGSAPIPGFVRGGPAYAAPEQLDDPALVNARTDIYGLGAAFYHLSFGVPPFAGGSPAQILDNRREHPMPSFSLRSQDAFSGRYLRLLHRMLAVNPGERPANPEALSEQLERFHQGSDSSVDWPVSPSGRTYRDPAGLAPARGGENRVFSLKLRPPAGAGSGIWLAAALILGAVILAALLLLS